MDKTATAKELLDSLTGALTFNADTNAIWSLWRQHSAARWTEEDVLRLGEVVGAAHRHMPELVKELWSRCPIDMQSETLIRGITRGDWRGGEIVELLPELGLSSDQLAATILGTLREATHANATHAAAQSAAHHRVPLSDVLTALATNADGDAATAGLRRVVSGSATPPGDLLVALSSVPAGRRARAVELLRASVSRDLQRWIHEWGYVLEHTRSWQGYERHFHRDWLHYISYIASQTFRVARVIGTAPLGSLLRWPALQRDVERVRRRAERSPSPLTPPQFLNLDSDVDFPPIIGLSLPRPVDFTYSSILRFEYLFRYARTKKEESVERLAGRLELRPEALIEQQTFSEKLQDEIADLREQMASALGDKRRDDSVERLASQHEELTRILENPEGPLTTLTDASVRLGEALLETGVEFDRFEPEGVLGEFRPRDVSATIYTEMVRLAASGPAFRRLGDEALPALLRLAEIHEAAHAFVVLGETCERSAWPAWDRAAYNLHEALAMSLTRRLAESLPSDDLVRSALAIVEELLPIEYRGAAHLRPLGNEAFRSLLLELRREPRQPGLRSLTEQLFAVSASASHLLAERLGERAYGELANCLSSGSRTLGAAPNAAEQCSARVAMISSITARVPEAIPLLEVLIGTHWPLDADLVLRSLVDVADGPAVGDGPLRLRLDWISAQPGRSALVGESDGSNAPAFGLPDYNVAMRQYPLLDSRTKSSTKPSRRR